MEELANTALKESLAALWRGVTSTGEGVRRSEGRKVRLQPLGPITSVAAVDEESAFEEKSCARNHRRFLCKQHMDMLNHFFKILLFR